MQTCWSTNWPCVSPTLICYEPFWKQGTGADACSHELF